MMMSHYKTLGKALDLGALGLELICSRCMRRTNFNAAQTMVIWKDRSLQQLLQGRGHTRYRRPVQEPPKAAIF